jgi:mono/diheme cytochrome c family protein/septal ring factor EnvC (AmiA/AmiB activator)
MNGPNPLSLFRSLALFGGLLVLAPAVAADDHFEKHVRTLLVEKCQSCHGPEKPKGGLRVDSRAALLKGGDTGPAIVPGKPNESLLVKAIGYSGELKMPPKGKLSEPEIGLLTEWIKAGGAWPESASGNAATDNTDVREPLAGQIDRIVAKSYLGPDVPLASDAEFHRRVYLDLVGRGPTVKETEAFLVRIRAKPDANPAIRAQVIDDLLGRDEFTRYFAKVLEVMFTERREPHIGMLEFRNWLRQCLEDCRPLNEICREILSADGTGEKNRAAAAFSLNRNAEPNLLTRDVGRIFFGRDVQCAQCHDHPNVPDYKQSEYHGIYSFVSRTYLFQDEKQGNRPYLGEKADGVLEFSSVFRPRDGKTVAKPVLPTALALDAEPDFQDEADAYIVKPDKQQRGLPRFSRRQQLAVLATHPENVAFNRNLANRLWATLMGMGVVHPVDLHHPGNPPISSELLRTLAEELVRSRYDVREFLRQVARSHAYQRSVIAPDLRNWSGPKGGVPALTAELTKLETEAKSVAPQRARWEQELTAATKKLQQTQAEVEQVQAQVDAAKKELQDFSGQRNTAVVTLAELQKKQSQSQETITALQSAVKELDKLVQLSPNDKELTATRTTLTNRLAAAAQTKQAADKDVQTQDEVVKKATARVDAQRSQVLVLANRKTALAEFVVEARGGVRRVRSQMLRLQDQESDDEQRKAHLKRMQEWLKTRDELRTTTENPEAAKQRQIQFNLRQQELLESWRRSYSLRRVRGLNGEQMGGAIYHALELDQPVRAKALADWEAKHQSDAKVKNDVAKRESHVTTAIAGNFWDTLEKEVMRRYSAPQGAPQDVFLATVDQALMIQNAPSVQAWLKPNPGTLTHRLAAIKSPNEVARQMYLAVLARLPEAEETAFVTKLLKENPKERAAIIQDLVWGLIASAEFRFSS